MALPLWAFLSQALHKEEQRSCLAAVARVTVLLVALGREPCANNSGGYCKARAKRPEKVIERLATQVADGCENNIPKQWLWKNRHVKLADGTTVSMPETEKNQQTYDRMPESLTLRQLSFTSAMQNMAASWVVLPTLDTPMAALMMTTQSS